MNSFVLGLYLAPSHVPYNQKEKPEIKIYKVHCYLFYMGFKLAFPSYVYWTVHHLYSCVKRKNHLDATCFII